MSPLESAIVRRKLAVMLETLERLKSAAGLSLADWIRDADRRDASKHRLQVCIEAAIDINAHLLVGAGHPAPADAYQSFLDVAEKLALLPRDQASRLAPAAALRNRLVHRYDTLDEELVLAAVEDALALLPGFIDAVETYLSRG
jgi:uncharacterized protein YutE (UPF0331/DUF86 family)